MRIRSLLLFVAACLIATLCSAQGRSGLTVVEGSATVTFSATPTFDASKANVFKITLTGNVTRSTLSNALIGQELIFSVCQDGTGGRTFVPPANVLGFLTIASAASACTTQWFTFDGTNAQPLIASANSVNGVSFPAGPSTHSVPVTTAANTETYKVVPDCTDTTGNHLNYTQSTDAWSCGTSVSANTVTTAGTQGLTNKTLGGSGSTTPHTISNRIRASGGSAVVAGDFTLNASWGSTASESVLAGSTDSAGQLSITANGTGIAANPLITFTFHDGAWPSRPTCVTGRNDSSGITAGMGYFAGNSTSTTQALFGLIATPTAGNTYIVTWICE
jgi:hypothetical protein